MMNFAYKIKLYIAPLICLFVLVKEANTSDISFSCDVRPVATRFDVMDNVSLWLEGFCDTAYRANWKKDLPLDKFDEDYFDKYRKLREKYFYSSENNTTYKSPDGLFAASDSAAEDPVALAFYESNTLPEALKKLSTIIAPEEISFLQEFYHRFDSRLASLLKQENSADALTKTRHSLAKAHVRIFLNRVSAFYQTNVPFMFTVLRTWYPPIGKNTATVCGNYLIFKSHPNIEEVDECDIVLHEVLHVISRHQSQEQKQKLTAAFLKTCEVPNSLLKLHIIEEPLAVAIGQMLFWDLTDKEKFKAIDENSTGQAPWYQGRPKGRGQAALAPCLPAPAVLYNV